MQILLNILQSSSQENDKEMVFHLEMVKFPGWGGNSPALKNKSSDHV